MYKDLRRKKGFEIGRKNLSDLPGQLRTRKQALPSQVTTLP
jgi:hypothetical protein